MKRYTTAQAISILSKPGREGWYAEAISEPGLFHEKITHGNGYYQFQFKPLGRGWEPRAVTNKRPDWRIIKPKREKLRRIGTTEAPTALVKAIHDLEKTGDDYEIFARRVGK